MCVEVPFCRGVLRPPVVKLPGGLPNLLLQPTTPPHQHDGVQDHVVSNIRYAYIYVSSLEDVS